MSAVPTDEIYDRYLKKAIAEINALGDELASHGDEPHVPVLGSGHPLGDVFLLKWTPQPSEIQEGVAFFGRSGQALLKSLQRLHVDPLAVYGTNCLKFGTEDAEEAARVADARAAYRPAEAARGDGRAHRRVRRRVALPARARVADDPQVSCSRFTPTIEALVTPDIDAALDEQTAKTALLERLQGARPLVGGAAALLSTRRAAALAARRRSARRLGRRGRSAAHVGIWRRRWSWRCSSCRSPSRFRGSLCPRRPREASCRSVRRSSSWPSCSTSRARNPLFNVTKLLAIDGARLPLPRAFRAAARLGRFGRGGHPWVDAFSVWRGPTTRRVRAPRPLRPYLDRLPLTRARTAPRTGAAGRPLLRALPGSRPALPAQHRLDVAVDVGSSALTLVLAASFDSTDLPALPAVRSASWSRTPTCSGSVAGRGLELKNG